MPGVSDGIDASMDILLEATGLRMENDRSKFKDPFRQWALDVHRFQVARADRVFVLADNHHGKSALHDAIHTMLNAGVLRGTNLRFNQPGRPQALHIDWFWRDSRTSFRKQGGSESEVSDFREKALSDWVISYADDPEHGPDIIDAADEKSATLLIASDPGLPQKRLHQTLGRFLQKRSGSILWLFNGTVFWEGRVDDFTLEVETLCDRYARLTADPGYRSARNDFVGAIREAARKPVC